MNYYAMRKQVAHDIAIDFVQKLPDVDYTEFQQKMTRKYGVSAEFVKKLLFQGYGLKIVEGQVVQE